eukprot:m51a1_g11710 hypothetical protein (1022) ;mRNA; f:62535-66059
MAQLDARSLDGLFRDRGNRDKLASLGGVGGVCQSLGVDPQSGVMAATEGVAARVTAFGDNRLPKRDHKGFFSFFFEAIQDKVLIILIIAAIVSLVLGAVVRDPYESEEDTRKTGWIEGLAILVAVFVVSAVSAGNDYSKDLKFRKLEEQKDDRHVKIRRDGGQEALLSVFDLVVGDIVLLETGDFTPADMLLITGRGLSIDESTLTGEPDSIKKEEQKDPFLMSGCKVMAGTGECVVCAVGVRSQWGILQMSLRDTESEGGLLSCLPSRKKKLKEEEEKKKKEAEEGGAEPTAHKDAETPLQKKLATMTERIAIFGLVAAIFVFVWLVCRLGIDVSRQKKRVEAAEFIVVVQYFITAITILVVAVPEGLPLAVTVALAYSMQKMMKDNNLVRHLTACETMGGATNICSDKTGTLTENRMTTQVKEATIDKLVENSALNSTAIIVHEEGKKDDFVGSKTECALLGLAEKWGCDYQLMRREAKPRIAQVFPFSSEQKSMCTVLRTDASRLVCHVKGASEIVFAMCDHIYGADGEARPIDDEIKAEMAKTIEELATQGLRTLCLATMEVPESDVDLNNQPSSGYTCVALVGIKDPVRGEVPLAVSQCQRAGIKVRMVTGDNIITASSIARECGILKDGDVAIEGPNFRALSDEEMDALIPRLSVIARCSPTDKLRLVNRLKARGDVVASTGDGTNDAPQLRAADVGFAMNIAGTEVAKEAADILLLDDNFASVVKAVSWGRNVSDSIRKFLQFQLTVNFVAVFLAVLSAAVNQYSPITAIQLLWVNLIMDTMAALALATEAPTPELLLRQPYGRFDSLVTPKMWRFILGHFAMQIAVLLSILYVGEHMWFFDDIERSGPMEKNEHLNTVVFNVFVIMQTANEINARRLLGELNVFANLIKNWLFLGILVFTLAVQVLIIEFGGVAFQTDKLNAKQWLGCFVFGVLPLPWNALLHFVPTPKSCPSLPSLRKSTSNKVHNVEVAPAVGTTAFHGGFKTAARALSVYGVLHKKVADHRMAMPADSLV